MNKSLKLPKKREIDIPASLFKRLIAVLIDFLIINFLIFAPLKDNFFVGQANLEKAYEIMLANPQLYTLMFIIAVMVYLYFVVFDLYLGQTPGRMVFRIFVKNKSKGKMTFWQCITRNLDILTFFIFFPLLFVDVVYALFNKERMRLSEKFSGTCSVERVVA